MTKSQILAKELIKHSLTLSIAESCTGGLLCHQMTNIPGSSAFLWLGVIAYDNKAKTRLLRVSPSLLKKHGAVSEPVALAMAQGAQQLLSTDLSIAITGIAGPGGGSQEKPVGTVFIAARKGKRAVSQHLRLKGSRLKIKTQACDAALKILIDLVKLRK